MRYLHFFPENPITWNTARAKGLSLTGAHVSYCLEPSLSFRSKNKKTDLVWLILPAQTLISMNKCAGLVTSVLIIHARTFHCFTKKWSICPLLAFLSAFSSLTPWSRRFRDNACRCQNIIVTYL